MLEKVKLALRITTTAFDTEISLLISDCITSMHNLGVTTAAADSTDPQIISAVIAYCKWKFGQNEEADRWRAIYEEKLAELKTQTGYTTWGA